MTDKEYSAGTAKLKFMFSEFGKVVNLLNDGMTLDAIKTLNKNEDIFLAKNNDTSIQTFNIIFNRICGLDSSMIQLFVASDLATQKLIALVAILQVDSLFFDFVYEVYRQQLIVGSDYLFDHDVRKFFADKQIQSERVAKWTHHTIKHLGTFYKKLLNEAGLVDDSMGDRKLLRPNIDKTLLGWLNHHNMQSINDALSVPHA